MIEITNKTIVQNLIRRNRDGIVTCQATIVTETGFPRVNITEAQYDELAERLAPYFESSSPTTTSYDTLAQKNGKPRRSNVRFGYVS